MKKTEYKAPEMKVKSLLGESLLQTVSGGDVPVDNRPGEDEGTAKEDFDASNFSVWED